MACVLICLLKQVACMDIDSIFVELLLWLYVMFDMCFAFYTGTERL